MTVDRKQYGYYEMLIAVWGSENMKISSNINFFFFNFNDLQAG